MSYRKSGIYSFFAIFDYLSGKKFGEKVRRKREKLGRKLGRKCRSKKLKPAYNLIFIYAHTCV